MDAPSPSASMHHATFTTTDNTPLAFQSSIPLSATTTTSPPPSNNLFSTCILLLHGFSGSSAYFAHNTPALSAHHWVLAPDMRGHGRSGHNPSHGGFHVARLAADLRELLLHVTTRLIPRTTTTHETRFVPVGCSIGAAVVWTYLELFGDPEGWFAGYVFVDQAPVQDRDVLGLGGAWGPDRAHRGCFDEGSLVAAQRAWVAGGRAVYEGLVEECLGYRFRPEEGDPVAGDARWERDEEFFVRISEGCDGVWLARLMADHTRYDHREACEAIGKPVLVLAARRSGCFSLEGMEETVRRVKKGGNEDAEMVVFESGHWLFYEEPERFNREVLKFIERCTA